MISISPRQYLGAAIALVATLLGAGVYVIRNEMATLEQRAQAANLLSEAVHEPQRRQQYLSTFQKPEHVLSIEYVDEKVQQMFNERGLQIPKRSHIMVMPTDLNNTSLPIEQWQGTKSKVYIFESQFPNYSQLPIQSPITKSQFYEGQNYILRARVEHNAGFQARMMSEGIEGFSPDSFKDTNGRFNNQLYTSTILLLSDLSEFSFHMDQKAMAKNPLVNQYLISLESAIAANYFQIISSLGRTDMDPGFRDRLIEQMSNAKKEAQNKDHSLKKNER